MAKAFILISERLLRVFVIQCGSYTCVELANKVYTYDIRSLYTSAYDTPYNSVVPDTAPSGPDTVGGSCRLNNDVAESLEVSLCSDCRPQKYEGSSDISRPRALLLPR